MHLRKNANLFLFYGIFLIICGILTITFLGFRAKTGLITGSVCGIISIAISYWMRTDKKIAYQTGLAFALTMLAIFTWRGSVAFLKLTALISTVDKDMRIKAIAFLIIAAMFVATLILAMIHVFHSPFGKDYEREHAPLHPEI